MKKIIAAVKARFHGHHEAGMATAEYAVGTVAVISIGGIIYKIISDPMFRDTIWELILWLFRMITGITG
ncbi:MAG: DUF4244 domain-containing protein [Propionibacteriaceae bacterium]|jgi:hypothetical protein|nr:DUF4244 domain-containing protein [Propionibacteriaceae bacterium]